MPTDKRQFEKAHEKWQELKEAGHYSLPAEQGTTAILCSYASPDPYATKVPKDIRNFRKEAFGIAELITATDRRAEVVLDAQSQDFTDVLRDPKISDIYTIGHGGLSSLYVRGGLTPYDWTDLSQATDHLKTGQFVQRHCAILKRHLSIPLGLFALSDMTSLYAPLGARDFNPRGLQHPDNDLFIPVLPQAVQLSYEGMQAMFSE